jgi:putative membrane protein
MGFVVRVLINGVAIWLATLVLSGMEVVGSETTGGRAGIILLIALVFGLVNAIVKPIVKVLAFPLYILTLGLFTVVVNALMLMLTAWITEHSDWGLRIDSFGTALIGALIIGVVSFALSVVAAPRERR